MRGNLTLRILLFATVLLLHLFSSFRTAIYASSVENPKPCPVGEQAGHVDHMVRPKYPKEALRAGIGGPVEATVLIGADGKTKAFKAEKGEPSLGHAAHDAIRRWRFHPAIIDGTPVETTYKVMIDFRWILQEAIPHIEIESPQQPPDPNGSTSKPEVYATGTPGLTPPRAIYSPEPQFSEEAHRKRQSGTVTLTLVVGANGKPQDVRIACSASFDLDANSVQTVNTWKFDPARKDGKPVAAEISVQVEFRLYN